MLGPERVAALAGRFARRLNEAADRLAGRRLWRVNSTAEGGGVAEMLHFPARAT
jgi:hypothetical protein